ncbi:TrmB family transcriptional regulator [Nanoarchaeota archaeon]
MDLRKLGLTEYEEKTYKALIKLGKSTASQISREAEVSYGKIYEVLASLERKGLVTVVPEKSKKFIPADPKNLFKLIELEENKLKKMRDEVSQLKQVYEFHEEEVIQVAKGKRNFYKLLNQMKDPETFEYTIKYSSEYNPKWLREYNQFTKKGVDIKTLTRYDDETKEAVDKWLKVDRKLKQFDNKGVAIDIRDSEVLIALIKSNVIMTIKDKAFIDLMKRLYEVAHENLKEIKEK